MMLQLQRYDFELCHKSGSEILLADTLSRAPRSRTESTNFEYEVMDITRISESRQEELITETSKDPAMQRLIDTMHRGWPRSPSTCPPETRSYFNFRDEIVVDNGIVMKGQKAVIPQLLFTEYAKILHRGHQGIDATKPRARDTVYWPGMNTDLERQVMECSVCNALKSHLQQEPLLLHDVPDLPWAIVATDLFEWNSIHYIVIVDSYSGWYEISTLHDIRSETIIKKLKRTFAVHGSPQIFISDNGGQFTSAQFTNFTHEWRECREESQATAGKDQKRRLRCVIELTQLRKCTQRYSPRITSSKTNVKIHQNTYVYPPQVAEASFYQPKDSKTPIAIGFSMFNHASKFARLKKKKVMQIICQWSVNFDTISLHLLLVLFSLKV